MKNDHYLEENNSSLIVKDCSFGERPKRIVSHENNNHCLVQKLVALELRK
jgi:hypothetical protein